MNENLTKSPISRWKHSDQSDVQEVMKLINDEVKRKYGVIDLPRLIETCSACITLFNNDDEVVAFIALCDFPNIPAVKHSWPNWIATNYGLGHLTPLNTLFIHLMAFHPLYYPEFFSHTIQKFYNNNELLDFIILLLPPKNDCYNLLNMYFNRVHKRKDVTPDQIDACYVNNRWLHFGKFALKKAGDEDGETITVKVKKTGGSSETPQFKKVVIQKDKFRTFIIEETQSAGDFMCLNTRVNYSILNEMYDLRSVNGFKSKITRREYRLLSNPAKMSHNNVQLSTDHAHKIQQKIISGMGERHDSLLQSEITSLISTFTQDNLRYEDVVLLDPGRLLKNIPYVTRVTSNNQQDLEDEAKPIELTKKTSFFNLSSLAIEPGPSLYELPVMIKRQNFLGQNNAFALEVFISYSKKARSIDYMRKMFEFSPNLLNYCLLELPASATPPRILNYFHKFEKFDKSYPYELYTAHQLAITGAMMVREGWPCDMQDILAMTVNTLYAFSLHGVIYDIFYNKISDKQVFVMISENIIIGVAVVSTEKRIEFLQSYYELDDLMCMSLHRSNEYGLVEHFIVSPLFYHYIRFFLKEIMRLTEYTSLFFTLYSKKIMKSTKLMTWPSGLQRWVPVAPRVVGCRQIKEDVPYMQDYCHDKPSFALFYINRRIASSTLHLDNRDVVVVGHGVTAMSFIENLIYSNKKCYFNFGNIKLVAPDSFATSETPEFDSDYRSLNPSSGKYTFSYIERIGIPAFVEFVRGTMTNIDREARFIEVDFSYHIHYDYLFLLCGTQFVRPDMKMVMEAESKMKVCKASLKGRSMEDYYSQDYPLNLYILDSLCDIDMFIHFIVNSYRFFTHEDYLVVYGGCLHAWACLNFLLKYIPGHEIAFVENLNDTTHSIDAFNNPLIHEACVEKITSDGVKYCSSYEFCEWEMRKQNHLISKVTFLGARDHISLKCVAFITFSPRLINPLTISAINNSGLEFDQKLVIDHKFRTSDPKIYAAGRLTRYSKEYYFDHFNHEHYSSIEVGTKLADIFLREACNESDSSAERELPPLVEMKEPVIVTCWLPGSVNYLHVSRPGPQVPFEQLASLGRIKKILVTGDVQGPSGPKYFRILLDNFDKVMDITCFSKEELDVVGLTRLYDKHEQMLNDLCWRYDNNMIKDLYEYFKQPWAFIIYHDRFDSFLKQVFPLHKNIKDTAEKKLYLKLAAGMNEALSENQKAYNKCKMLSILNKHGLDRRLCDSLMYFLEYNKDLLPHYLGPSRLTKQETESYRMNQLLEPPNFARNHLKKHVQQFNMPPDLKSSSSELNDEDDNDFGICKNLE